MDLYDKSHYPQVQTIVLTPSITTDHKKLKSTERFMPERSNPVTGSNVASPLAIQAQTPVSVKVESESAKQSESERDADSDAICSEDESDSDPDSDSDFGEHGQDHQALVLGFAEEVGKDESAAEVFAASRFPSKLGGLPVWLHGNRAPPAQICDRCGAVLAFLLQLYAPYESDDGGNDGGHAFHRMLYVFVCRADECSGGKGTAKVLSAVLPRRNEFYAYNAEESENEVGHAGRKSTSAALETSGQGCCALCGFAAPTRCGQCSSVAYCSRQCQRTDWRSCGHKDHCGVDGSSAEGAKRRAAWRFNEHDIVHGPCPGPSAFRSVCVSDVEKERLEVAAEKEVKLTTTAKTKTTSKQSTGKVGIDELAAAMKAGSLQDVDASEMPSSLFQTARDGKSRRTRDRAFQRFSDAMRLAPDQVVRYWRGGRPLWASADHLPDLSSALDTCDRCGDARVFEFQVVSQAVWYVGKAGVAGGLRGGAGGLDFGTIAVYSCARACTAGEGNCDGYGIEGTWVQKLSATGEC
jgi:pre-rRNA-processing protein TSR4